MVSISVVRATNAQLPEVLPNGISAVFVGATSGIGLAFLQQYATATVDKSSHLYVVGRSASAATEQLADLRRRNPSAKVEFIEQDISLVRNVDALAQAVRSREEELDLLYLSAGFIPFSGRKDTREGLEPSMTTRYYSRVRAIQLLLPLLERSSHPHVINILAGGQEAPVDEEDLDLRKPGNFSFIKASVHSATMLTLVLERFAAEHPRISFVHAFPGLTDTPILTRGSTGIVGFLMRRIVQPFLNTFFAASVADVAAKVLFYSTNARYTVPETVSTVTPLPEGLSVLQQTPKGLFLVDAIGEVTGDEKLLGDLRGRVADQVWDHTENIFQNLP